MTRDIRQLDLNLLKALDALLTERHVTRAAARLNLTQPAVSGMLARLRDAFDDSLFLRSQRGIVPTPRALQLAEPLRRMLAEAEALLTPPAFDPASARLTLSLAATDYALQVVVVPFLERLRQQAPGIRVAVLTEGSATLGHFEQGDLDLALMAPPSVPPGLHERPLFDETYVVAMREGHPDAGEGALSLDRFCALDHALVSLAGGGFRGVTDAALAAIGRERQVMLSVTSFLVLAQVLHGSDLIAVVPRRLVQGVAGLTMREPPLAIPGFSKVMVWHERTQRDPAHRWLRDLLAG
ncbi:LysR family transcriptional regulator [Novosphingobium terrae]|uniref:LysR family transcriptional regulator n=1 Tax=Novosphingobium terrae TaxID=2726189 RepID=UPI00197D375F|nr:LysR family transcriptional regulator [Novosphingobium terrae]